MNYLYSFYFVTPNFYHKCYFNASTRITLLFGINMLLKINRSYMHKLIFRGIVGIEFGERPKNIFELKVIKAILQKP